MEALISYFEDIPSSHRTLWLVSGIVFFWLLETAAPLFRFSYNKWKHAGVNIFFTVTTAVINLPLAFLLVWASDWTVQHNFGVLQWLPALPLWLQAFIGLLLLDLIGAYFVHWSEHKVKVMWRFHFIHHTDMHIDATSANRHHPGESVFRLAFTVLAVFVAGAPMWLVFLYQSLSVLLSQFNHANITLPKTLDRALNWLIVTPDMHHIHHHYLQPYTDANYGNIFSVWDRIFGTLMVLEQDKIVYGVDTHPDEVANGKVLPLLKIPFEK
jgi:sterol desaturase/sphingolipid hydroxylase (fatty acid hydroxylase superfamily)